jgi:hypothetical protein
MTANAARKPKRLLNGTGGPYHPEDIDEQNIATAFERLAKSQPAKQSKAVKK